MDFRGKEKTEQQMAYLERAREAAKDFALRLGHAPKSHIETFGCQMNARDSEKLRGILREAGFADTEEENEADFVLYNTCTVRDNADQHVYGRLGRLGGNRKSHPGRIVGLCGCLMQEPHAVEKIRKSYPFVNLVFGTHNLYAFPELLYRVLTEKKRVFAIEEKTTVLPESLPVERKHGFKSGVNIMYGCNNFCTYCIVPYVRGREISREPEDILKELETLAADGVKEVMLLGQNVNSYGKGLENPVTFAGLLHRACKVEGIERIRFMTSHPKDLGQDLIEAMATEPKICPHLHLPVQSGSDGLLKKMNRHYDRAHYLGLVKALREAVPDISLTTDIIVGFPGETEEDFEETLSLVREVGYDSAFTFLYSKRAGTPAASYPDQVSDEVAHARFERLLSTVKETAEERCGRFLGQVKGVLVEEENREPGMVTGRTPENIVVHFPGSREDIGKTISVRLSEAKGFYYFGERIAEDA